MPEPQPSLTICFYYAPVRPYLLRTPITTGICMLIEQNISPSNMRMNMLVAGQCSCWLQLPTDVTRIIIACFR